MADDTTKFCFELPTDLKGFVRNPVGKYGHKSWGATVSPYPTGQGYDYGRWFWPKSGDYFKVPSNLKIGEVIEFRVAQYGFNDKGYRAEVQFRFYGVVKAVAPEKIVFEEHLDLNAAFAASPLWAMRRAATDTGETDVAGKPPAS